MPLVQTRGAASAQGFGEFAQASGPVTYIEDVFSTYLYTGNGTSQTITNNIDLSTKGGLVWIKATNPSFNFNQNLSDTNRGTGKFLSSNTTAAQGSDVNDITAFNTTGFAIGSNQRVNDSSYKYVSWTFREQPKFFDVVTWTGNATNRTIAHSLGSVPGSIFVKRTDTTANWAVYHRSLANTQYLVLNDSAAAATGATWWNSTTPTSSVFSLGTDATVNASGGTYVAYIFAHDSGGFGLSGTDNVITCGTFTNDAAGAGTVNLGYEPQWVIFKNATSADGWYMYDSMRGFSMASSARTTANGTYGDSIDSPPLFSPSITTSSTGFSLYAGLTAGSSNIIYIAIRRGPMKVPTLGTSVFNTVARTGTGATATVTAGFPVDMYLMQRRPTSSFPNIVDRLRGNTRNIQTYQTDAETTTTNTVTGFDNMTAAIVGADTPGYVNESGITYANQMFRRAPSFFDEVCYTGTGVAGLTVNHNLTVAPELVIIKKRTGYTTDWDVSTLLGATTYTRLFLNTNDALYLGTPQTYGVAGVPLYSKPTATQLQFGVNTYVNAVADYVAYLFATCPGVSKVGSYTGTATTLQINCGFTAGARFVLIKRTDSTGDWYVWDSARGIVAGNDPYLLLNSTAAEVTNTDYVDTYSAGFEISSTAPAAINASAGTFVFLAIA